MLVVRNVDCGGLNPFEFCPMPGDPTAVEVTIGGTVGLLEVYDTSTATVSGGSVPGGIKAWDSARVDLTGDIITAGVSARDTATVSMSGGSTGTGADIQTYGNGTATTPPALWTAA